MAAITVEQRLFERLRQAYAEKFGSSPSLLIPALNQVVQGRDEVASDLISSRTVRSFFNATQAVKMKEKNLNYLCRVLLDCSSYQEALRQNETSEKKDQENLDSTEDWYPCYQQYIRRKCGTMKVLNMAHPVELDSIYATVNILEKIKGRKHKTIAELLSDLSQEDKSFNCFNSGLSDRRVMALDAVRRYRKLLIWGHPGAGKTTFLKHLAIHPEQELAEPVIPVFISLKNFSESKSKLSLTKTITKEFSTCIQDPIQLVQSLLQEGKCLILLDGLDEIVESKVSKVYRAIDRFLEKYPHNRFVMTCRLGASEYVFKDFTEVGIAAFDGDQVSRFVKGWFEIRQEPELAERFLTKLEEDRSVKELVSNPLLLTMLCLVFGDSYEFPRNRYWLHEEAVNILLRKWDASRRIERDSIYNNGLIRQREITLLGQIAYDGFSQEPQKFFWQRKELEELIRNFIQNIPGINPETLEFDSQAILKTIETKYGLLVEQAKDIYSFSHLSFQEYFTAQHIVENRTPEAMHTVIVRRIIDRQWRQVFLMISGRLANADEFLKMIFFQINLLVRPQVFQELLGWLDRVTRLHGVASSSWRAFYLATDQEFNLYTSHQVNYKTRADFILIQQLASHLREINHQECKLIQRSPMSDFALTLVDTYTKALHKIQEPDRTTHEISPLLSKELPVHEFSLTARLQEGILVDKEKGTITISKPKGKIVISKESLPVKSQSSINLQAEEAADLDYGQREQDIIETARSLQYNDLADELTFLKESFPSNAAPAWEWQEWAGKLKALMILYLDIGYDVKLSSEHLKILEDYFYANVLLLECMRGDSYSSKDLRNQMIDHLLLPHKRIPSELFTSRFV